MLDLIRNTFSIPPCLHPRGQDTHDGRVRGDLGAIVIRAVVADQQVDEPYETQIQLQQAMGLVLAFRCTA